MPAQYHLNLPLYVGGDQKKNNTNKANKRFWLTLNNYRNWHYQTSNAVKIKFKKAMEQQILALPNLTDLWGQVKFRYVYYAPNRAIRDLNNVVGVIDKFFADALVELGKLKDDSCEFIPAYSCEFGDIDKNNPRLEVFIEPYSQTQNTGASMAKISVYTPRKITPQNENMLPSTHTPETRKSYVLINLTEEEIAEAVRNYIRGQIPMKNDSELPVTFVAGRGDNGITSTVTVDPLPVTVVPAQQPNAVSASYDAVASTIQDEAEEATQSEVVIEEMAESNDSQSPDDSASEPEAQPETAEQPHEPAVSEVLEEPVVIDHTKTEPDPSQMASERKKSNLFAAPETLPVAEASQPEATPMETVETTPEPASSKPRSIFD